MKPDGESLRTSWTLVAHLKNADDHQSWQDFYTLYRNLILGVAIKAGLQPPEAEDVVQETMLSVSKHIRDFEADPARGSFRAWLLTMAKWRITDQFRKRPPGAEAGRSPSDASATTPTIERVPNANEVDLEGLCDAEWNQCLQEQAMKLLQFEVKAEHYQIFYLLTAGRKSVAEVAGMVGCNRAHVYLVKHRVAKALKRIVKNMEKQLG